MINYLYLHVPFCKTICGYCDFCHYIYNKNKVNQWLECLKTEIESKKINKKLKTIYIGGGTPTSLNEEELDKLLSLLKPYSKNIIEYTIEANPETITEEKVLILKKYGINRVSIGVQSSDDKLLKIMNRRHNFESVKECIKLLKKHKITNISVDFMYGLPFQTMDDLNKSLHDFITLDVPHISIYSLTIEENTPFYKRGYKKMDDDLEADMYDRIIDFLRLNGYAQYEISSFCKDDLKSIHNMAYWNYEDFYGISMSASGKNKNLRYDNTKNFNKYLKKEYIENEIYLSKNDEMFEYIMMGFRLKDGFDYLKFDKKFKISFLKRYELILNDLLKNGLIAVEGKYIKCIEKGYKLLNNVLEKFLIGDS